jgi:single-stranded DNA-binding protein
MSNENLKKNSTHSSNNGRKLKPKVAIPNSWNGFGLVETPLELRKTNETDGSKSVVNFTLKVKQQYKVRDPETNQQEVKYKMLSFPVTAWDSVAENLCASVKKNDLIKLNGYIRTFQVKTRNTKNVLSFEIVCNRFSSVVRKDKPKDKNVVIINKNDRRRTEQN